jgi:Pretoxin HINT domain
LEGQFEPLGVTVNHPVYSEDRRAFVPAGELKIGERLRPMDGGIRVVALFPRPGTHRVYNLEVNAEHAYRISERGLLVHNNCEVSVHGGEPNFTIVESGPSPRSVRFRPQDPANPGRGLTQAHLKKHFFGSKPTALQQIDPGGTADEWSQYLAELIRSPVTGSTSNGMLDIVKLFPRADGSGLFKLGVRLAPKPDGTFDLITVLTKQ